MSSAHPHTAKLSKSELADLLAEAMADPKVKARLAKPYKLVTSYDIALLGSSSIGGENVYLDRHLREGRGRGEDSPRRGAFGVLTVEGRKLDVKPGLIRHERLEQALEDIFGWSYEIAHEVATAYEEQLYRAKGFDPRKVEAAFEPYIKNDEGENIVRTPTDLDMRPMLGDKKLLARVKAAAEKEKKTHESVGYVAKSSKPNQSCGKCKMFIRPEYGGPCCTLVKSPITAGGWCRRFWAGTLGYAQGGRVKGYADGGDAQEYWGEGLPPSQMRQAPIAEDIGRGIVNTAVGLATLPQRALEASEGLRYGLPYDPGPAVEAATLPMTGGLAAPVRAWPGEQILGSGFARSERFNWPVRTEYGNTIDMPITVNPSRRDIMRELASAPHGDVRALRSPDGNVYLWPANEAMHVDIASNFDLPFKNRADLQSASYLFNKGDVDRLGGFKSFDDLVSRLGGSDSAPFNGPTFGAGPTDKRGAAAVAATQGIRAYHGSPYDFDRFDMSKIGTGEGAQAYGHGLYFAENPEVAQTYKVSPNQKTMGPAATWVAKAGGDWAKALQNFDEFIGGAPKTPAQAQVREDLLRGNQPGRMYEVGINADPEHFLDWDKPLSEQSEQVRKGLSSLPTARMADPFDEIFEPHASEAEGTVPHLMRRLGANDADASNQLRSAGIPGIKYLDQGSRAGGEGTRNYVLFRDDIIDIIKKYGIAGLMALPPSVQMMLDKDRNQ